MTISREARRRLLSRAGVRFFGFALHAAFAQRPEDAPRLGPIPILFALSMPSQFLAWSSLWTGVDVVFNAYCLAASALALIIMAVARLCREPMRRTS
jgi:hypothetical protein